MKLIASCLLMFLLLSCRPAAAPVAISNKPVSINDIRQPNVQMPPSKPLSEMSWTDFDGKVQRLMDLEGKVVILDFWATYCPPCIEEIPHLNALRAKYGDENLQIVGLHVGGEDDRPLVPEFAERLKISYPLATPEGELTNFIFANRSDIPQTAIFDRKGVMVKKIVGFSDAIKKELDAAVEIAINSK